MKTSKAWSLYQTISVFFLLVFVVKSFSQERIDSAEYPSVSKSIFEIQLNPLEYHLVYEHRLHRSIVLRVEAGVDMLIFRSRRSDEITWIVGAPTFILEPRWYFNRRARQRRGHKIVNNSSAFISIQNRFRSDWYIPKGENIARERALSIIPTFGARYATGKHLSFETGIGVGVGYNSYQSTPWNEYDFVYTALNLHLRLGYRF